MSSNSDLLKSDPHGKNDTWEFILHDGSKLCCELSSDTFVKLVISNAITAQTLVANSSYTFGVFRTAREVPPVCAAMAFCQFSHAAESVTETPIISVDDLRSEWYSKARGTSEFSHSGLPSECKDKSPHFSPKIVVAAVAVVAWVFLYFTIGAGSSSSQPSYSVPHSRYYDPTYRPQVGEKYIQTYTKSDGTLVEGHFRTKADDSFFNNYSSEGSINPHTGQEGKRRP